MESRLDAKAEHERHGLHELLAAFGALARHGEASKGREADWGHTQPDAAVMTMTGHTGTGI